MRPGQSVEQSYRELLEKAARIFEGEISPNNPPYYWSSKRQWLEDYERTRRFELIEKHESKNAVQV